MKTKPPFNMDDDFKTNKEKIEKRLRERLDQKYDLLGINKDQDFRDKLFDYEMAIFLNQFLWRTINSKDFG